MSKDGASTHPRYLIRVDGQDYHLPVSSFVLLWEISKSPDQFVSIANIPFVHNLRPYVTMYHLRLVLSELGLHWQAAATDWRGGYRLHVQPNAVVTVNPDLHLDKYGNISVI